MIFKDDLLEFYIKNLNNRSYINFIDFLITQTIKSNEPNSIKNSNLLFKEFDIKKRRK